MTKIQTITVGLLFGCFLQGCSEDPNLIEVADNSAVPAEILEEIRRVQCTDEPGISYICGLENAEDILRLGDSNWLLVSGMNGELVGSNANGKIHAVNLETHEFFVAFPAGNPDLAFDTETYDSCPGPIDVSNFSAHGLALRELDENSFDLYMTSHGAREAVETFQINMISGSPEITWTGCVPMPSTAWINSVVILEDKGLMTTVFMSPPESGIAEVIAGEITGYVLEWHPGGEVFMIPGTELSGANGIAINEEENTIYVASFGGNEIVRFELAGNRVSKSSVSISVTPDNVRWTPHGTLITAGGNVTEACEEAECGAGWSVYEIDPADMSARFLTGVGEGTAIGAASSALVVGDEIWIGTYEGDRIGIMPLP